MTQLNPIRSLFCIAAMSMICTTSMASAQVAPGLAEPPVKKVALDMGEDPGPVYTRLVKQWAETTRFAQNAAEVAVGKLELDMQSDPKLKKILTKNLIADLEQFFYELFISPETISALAKVYAQYFTLDELNELIQFYQSPLGQKLVKNNAELTLKTQQIGMNLLKEHEKGYMQIIAKYVQQGAAQ